MNDNDRIQWIANDEGLHNWFRRWRKLRHSAGRHVRHFVRENRAEIDAAIANMTEGREPAHYLAYPRK